MDKEILIGTTLREFNKNDNHYETQILFLESIKKQTYQNYRLIVTEFFEKNLKETLNKFNLKYTLIKSRKLEFLKNINAKFSHCLPLRRNIKATDAVMDSDYCVAIQEAGNRLHVQKSLLTKLLKEN